MARAAGGASGRVALRELSRLRLEFGRGPAQRKRVLLSQLERASLVTSADLLGLHEALCFMRAYPDDRAALAQAERMLARFERRADLRRHRAKLGDSGIAGTAIRYRFFAETMGWLADRWPGHLRIDWDEIDESPLLERLLPLLGIDAETPGFDEYDYGLRGWIDRMKGAGETDAAFLIQRLRARVPDSFLHEALADFLDLPFVLEPGSGTPSRTLALGPRKRVAFQRAPLASGRPSLAAEAQRAPLAVRPVSSREGRKLIDLALAAMITRSRDLDVFAYGDPRDVRMVEWGDGLSFACIGARPERRLLLESVYGFLTLKNGVPVGYVLTGALYGSAEIAYNVFETFRGAEAAAIYARVLAMTRHLFGADTFTIPSYQLGGAGNDEGLRSGAWWFYRKLGWAPRDRGARRMIAAEEGRMRRRASHRSSLATLAKLAEHPLFFSTGRARTDVMGVIPLARAGLAVTRAISKRYGADRERAQRDCEVAAMNLLGVSRLAGWTRSERHAFARWAPLVALLPGLEGWDQDERAALLDVVRAKGGRRESDFVQRFDGHSKLRQSLRVLVERTRE
ncbi:MAG TPA: hypothetical protein VL123_08965 [Candidatus Udaeobacter sp.]|jgi:hypothetical protein|nr:hypothetical protein [Candidatus Udaeobacter sp.]